jgi:hypothetical protein
VQIDADAESGGERIVAGRENVHGNAVINGCPGADGLMSNAHEGVHERGNPRRESQFRSKEIRLHVAGTGTSDRSVMAAKIRRDADERKKFVGGRKIIAIQVGMLSDGTRYGRASSRAGAGLFISD